MDVFIPSRSAALQRLKDFVPRAGVRYARSRNYDEGPGHRQTVSALSPYVRSRALTEAEIVERVLATHGYGAAEKFIQEVCWRTYWKGWLEQRPAVWAAYSAGLSDAQRLDGPPAELLARATAARTGIDAFDAWVHELTETGYLHNHARMWFASIWIFTLRLPWELGAAFFLRHLLDGDPASNTLSWRWVAGLHTRGKTYLARPDNIATYTRGRFSPRGLAASALPVEGAPAPPALPVAPLPERPPRGAFVLLIHSDDLSPETLDLPRHDVAAVSWLEDRADGSVSAKVRDFRAALGMDALWRAGEHFGCPTLNARDLAALLAQSGHRRVVATAPTIGPAHEALAAIRPQLQAAGVELVEIRRRWDTLFWPHATKGFFALKDRIPSVLETLKLIPGQRDAS
jgi:deoxyribodipyrimidine photo-lyase